MAIDALNRLSKWRTVLAGWHLGSMSVDRPGVAAMRDLQDFRLVVRAELTAVTALLIEKGVFTSEELTRQVGIEAHFMDKQMETLFPGFRTTATGLIMDPAEASVTMKQKGFPE